MATEQELLDAAAANARATTITWDAFLEQVRTQAGFDYRSTQWYAAGADLEQLKSVPATPGPTPTLGDLSSARARIFLAQSPLDCWRRRRGWSPSAPLTPATASGTRPT